MKKLGSLLRQKLTQKFLAYLGKVLLFAIAYCAVSFIIVGIFTGVFCAKGALPVEAFYKSLFAYLGKIDIASESRKVELIELFMNRLVTLGIVAKLAQNLITPTNPIELASCVCVNNQSGKLQLIIRYWLMKPANEFMFDVHLRAYLQQPSEAYQENVSNIESWDVKYSMNRGICQWAIDLDEKQLGIIDGFPEEKNEYEVPILFYKSLCDEENFLSVEKDTLKLMKKEYHAITEAGRERKMRVEAFEGIEEELKKERYNLIVSIRATDETGRRFSAG